MNNSTRKKLTKAFMSGVILCLGVFVILFAVGCNGDKLGEVKITAGGKAVSGYEIYTGGGSVQFGYSTSKGTAERAVFGIDGESLDCEITTDGLFKSGRNGGTVKVSVTVTLKDKTKTASIDVVIKSRGLNNITAATANTAYIEGQRFNKEGLTVAATFANAVNENVTGYIIVDADKRLTPADTSITVSYTEGGVTKTALVPVVVTPKTLESIIAVASKAAYTEGEVLDNNSFTVTAQYEYIEYTVTDFTLSKITPLTVGDAQVAIRYTENGITKETVLPISVTGKTLQSIEVTAPPVKTNYTEGETFDATGLVILKKYEYLQDTAAGWIIGNSGQLLPTDTTVTVNYTENGVTKSVSITITVAVRILQNIEITAPPIVSYIEGQTFDTTGLTVTAYYEYKTLTAAGYTVDITRKLLPADTSVVIRYTENGVTKQASINITVAAKTLQSIAVVSLPAKTSYIEGQSFIPDGLEIKAVYEYVESVITAYTLTVSDVLLLGSEAVYVSFTDGAATKNTMFNLNCQTYNGSVLTLSVLRCIIIV